MAVKSPDRPLPFGAIPMADTVWKRPDGSSFLQPVRETDVVRSRDAVKIPKPRDLREDLAQAITTVDSLLHSQNGSWEVFDNARKNMRTLMDEAIDYRLDLRDFGVSKSSFTLKHELPKKT